MIANKSSIASFEGQIGQMSYAAANGGVKAWRWWQPVILRLSATAP